MVQLRLKESHPSLRLQRQLRRPFAGRPRSRRGRHWPAAFAHGEGSPRLHRDARGQKTSQKKNRRPEKEKKSCRIVRSWEAFILRSRRFNWFWPPLGKRICSLMHPTRKRRLENFKRRRALIGTGCEHGESVQTVPRASSARRCLLIVIGLCYLNGSKSAFFNQVARWQRGEFLTTESERLTSPVKPWRWWWVQRQPLHSSLIHLRAPRNTTTQLLAQGNHHFGYFNMCPNPQSFECKQTRRRQIDALPLDSLTFHQTFCPEKRAGGVSVNRHSHREAISVSREGP